MLGEILGLAPSQPGDEDEVVVVSELLLAQVAEVADPAVVARPRVRLGLGLERAEEPLARAPEVGHVLGGAERLALPVPSSTWKCSGSFPWIRPSCSE